MAWLTRAGPHTEVYSIKLLLWYPAQVPDVDIVLGCGDSPCSKLPSPKRPAAGRLRRRRRLRASMPHDTTRHGNAASAGGGGGGGNGSHSSGHCGCHGSSGSRGQPEVDDFGTLLPTLRCGGIQQDEESSSADSAVGGRSSLSAGAGAGSVTGGRSSSVHSTVSSGGGGGGGGQAAVGSQQRRALAEDPAEREPPPPPLPMFMYDTRETHADIPYPDFSYWGHEMDRLWGAKGVHLPLRALTHA